eukprot:GHVT01054429.1.p1 GENE.GHVT01054429.1~~GHVT01054429.1.p1  ORF type:complete len:155 (+),score=23.21 GHVT01054429.1:580-1044(+)
MRKKVDRRVREVVASCVAQGHRGLFVMVGDRGRDQVVNLHYLLHKLVERRLSVLWCYKKELGFSSHKKKRMKVIKKKMSKGQFDPNVDEPFQLFVSTTDIRYCYYRESGNILGQSFDLCILQVTRQTKIKPQTNCSSSVLSASNPLLKFGPSVN